jgi:hypothetical protein
MVVRLQFNESPTPRGKMTLGTRRGPGMRHILLLWGFGLGLAPAAVAQTTGQVLGRVIEEDTRNAIAAAEIVLRLEDERELRTLTTDNGDFILTNVPAGEHRLRVERIGFRPVILTLLIRPTRATQITVEMQPMPVEVEGVTAEVERLRLIEPDVTVSHEVVLGTQLRTLPVDEVEEVVELTTGVSGGRFRGGRIGQETYQIDGLEVKNQLEAATQGPAIELSPSSLQEVEVVTGGFRADNGSALSGVVSYVTRRGGTERWEGRGSLLTDHWAPDGLFRGFTGLNISAGGPLPFLGENSTLFTDLLAQGFIDGDARARGLTCLEPDEGDADLPAAIAGLTNDPGAAHLYCPFSESRLPYQRGDKLIGFARLDRPASPSTNLTFTFLHNRRQQELYTPEFKYNSLFHLGQRTKTYLGTTTLDWTGHGGPRVYHIVARVAALRLDRYLGALDPWTFESRERIAGFGLSDFRFLGEDYARSPIEEQLASTRPVPGYVAPGGATGSPFGPAAEGIFFTEGTPDVAAWNRTDFLGGDLIGEVLWTGGHSLRAGVNTRFYRIESYERTLASLPGSLPSFARFYPRTISGYAEGSMLAAHDITVQFGLRVESFQSGLTFQENEADFLSPTIDTQWHTTVMPRIGTAVPVPGTDERTMFRFNYGLVAQPPDFRFFLDTTIGDSLRTDIRRQGNPNLTFEKGTSWEASLSHLISDAVSVDVTLFLKELDNLVTSGLTFAGFSQNQFTTGDFGSVRGAEVSLHAIWPLLQLRAGYALQSAKGVTSSAFEDPGGVLRQRREEFPLAFDRRHSADVTIAYGRAAGADESRWSATLTGSVRSGYPVNRIVTDPQQIDQGVTERLPWTGLVNLRLSREFGSLPMCTGCRWRIIADGRNLLGLDNIIALRRDTGELAPPTADLQAIANEVPMDMPPIPRESPLYSAQIDLDGNGLITAAEMRTGRFAAALDRADPSLFFGQARELRLGVEVEF